MTDPQSSSRIGSLVRHLRAKDLAVAALLAAAMLQFRAGAGDVSIAKDRPRATHRTASQTPGMQATLPGSVQAPPLVTEVAAPGYAPGSSERAVFDALNEARERGNFGLLAQDPRLDTAAARHADYLARNLNGALSHLQDSRLPAFLGETPIDRVRASGYDTQVNFEAISSGTSAQACLELLNTVYHLGSLMIGATDVGIAVNPAAGCVIEPQLPRRMERMQARRAGTVGVYPYPGQRSVPAAFMPATEMPNPAPDLGDTVVGPPILVDLNSDAAVSPAVGGIVLARFALVEAATGRPVETRILGSRGVAAAPGAALDVRVDRRLTSAGHVFLLPMQPLKTATAYAVDFSGSVNGIGVNRRWDFTTR